MKSITGFPFRTDGGRNSALKGGQCIIGADGQTCMGEIVADEQFTSKVIGALNQQERLEVPRDMLLTILGMAECNHEDVASGLHDGTYKAEENLQFSERANALEYFKGLLDSNVTIAAFAA